jgi:hypothetical protein
MCISICICTIFFLKNITIFYPKKQTPTWSKLYRLHCAPRGSCGSGFSSCMPLIISITFFITTVAPRTNWALFKGGWHVRGHFL